MSLREHSRNLYQTAWEDKIKVGDIVLIKAFNKPRPFWMMGRVLQRITGADGKVRIVKIKQSNGLEEHHSLKNLYPLELSITHPGVQNQASNSSESQNLNDNIEEKGAVARPKRAATQRFNKMLKDNRGNL